jgi:prepilin-type N-terminal cleavage/methylation domain-containing protein
MNRMTKQSIKGSKFSQKGFTIVELMIATVIFSFVLLVASSGIIAIGKIYYKGITSSKTQEVTRSIMEEVSRARQFSTGDVGFGSMGTASAYCFGEDRYSYRTNVKVDTAAGTRALVHDIRTNLNLCVPDINTPTGEELLGNNMRLLEFAVVPIPGSSNKSNISVKVAYGDNDLLSNHDGNGNPNGLAADQALCKPGPGSNFCATAELETVVVKRYSK